MLGLLYKEIVSNKKTIIPMFLVLGFFELAMLAVMISVTVFGSERLEDWELGLMYMLCSICVFFILLFLEPCINQNDEMKKWQAFIVSTEDGLKKQVGSKYLMCFITATVTYNLMNVIGSISAASMGLDITIFQTLGMQFIWMLLLLYSIEMPFMLAFGVKKGEKIREIICLLIAFAGAAYLCFGDLSIFGDPVRLVFWLKDLAQDNSNYFLLLTPPVTLILYYISYRISCKVYLNGGEHYEK